jgi:hypothetical protein
MQGKLRGKFEIRSNKSTVMLNVFLYLDKNEINFDQHHVIK